MEESGASGSDNWSWRWVVDPLDGTTNFLHGIPHWAISIGLERRLPDGTSELAAGLIYAPAADELFWAEKGGGAFVNEKRMRVSARRDITEAVFATGIPFRAVSAARRNAFAGLIALMPQVAGIRRFGAAALDLAWVAAGRYEGYWELGIHPWDMAAGLLMVREAGGYASGTGEGSPRDRWQRRRREPTSACEVAGSRDPGHDSVEVTRRSVSSPRKLTPWYIANTGHGPGLPHRPPFAMGGPDPGHPERAERSPIRPRPGLVAQAASWPWAGRPGRPERAERSPIRATAATLPRRPLSVMARPYRQWPALIRHRRA